jgi:hypothetical protein
MNKHIKYSGIIISLLIAIMSLSACKDFFDPDQEVNITDEKMFNDWYEYRSAAMGLYGLQQKLAEQLLVLGELRGDLLTVTANADADLVEINNFNVSKTNKYASPTNFFKLIAACNNFIRVLQREHPEVTDTVSAITNYDKLYGEALCMRAWAYFTAVKIYGKVPFIYESLTSLEEIENYVNSGSIYIDSVYIDFGTDGFHNDTIYNKPDTLEKTYYDMDLVVDYFANQLENEVRAVGVQYDINSADPTWEICTWNTWARHALLGTMYLTQGDLISAERHFNSITQSVTERYQLLRTVRIGTTSYNGYDNYNWMDIFSGLNNTEDIYVIYFNKANFQQNQFQEFFETRAPHKYMLRPTKIAVQKWESTFSNQVFPVVINDQQARLARMQETGFPGDVFRGHGVSFVYYYYGLQQMPDMYWQSMLYLKKIGDERSVRIIMEGADTLVYKYSINKQPYDQDAHFIVYRAASIHLYLAEINAYRAFLDNSGVLFTSMGEALKMVNDGSNYAQGSASRVQAGVRGRVGLGSSQDGIKVSDFVFINDPITNEITGYRNLMNNPSAKQRLLEELIMDERARELAFEGDRFYDLMRVAKRRNDPSFLASRVSGKFPAGQREAIYSYLLNEDNWYIHYFE